MSPVPILDCCIQGSDGKINPEAMPHYKRFFWEKMPPIYAEVAKETGVKYIDLFEIFKNKP